MQVFGRNKGNKVLMVGVGCESALPLNKRILKANAVVFGKGGVAGVKASIDLAGHHGGAPRRPLAALSEVQREQMRRTLIDPGFLE